MYFTQKVHLALRMHSSVKEHSALKLLLTLKKYFAKNALHGPARQITLIDQIDGPIFFSSKLHFFLYIVKVRSFRVWWYWHKRAAFQRSSFGRLAFRRLAFGRSTAGHDGPFSRSILIQKKIWVMQSYWDIYKLEQTSWLGLWDRKQQSQKILKLFGTLIFLSAKQQLYFLENHWLTDQLTHCLRISS